MNNYKRHKISFLIWFHLLLLCVLANTSLSRVDNNLFTYKNISSTDLESFEEQTKEEEFEVTNKREINLKIRSSFRGNLLEKNENKRESHYKYKNRLLERCVLYIYIYLYIKDVYIHTHTRTHSSVNFYTPQFLVLLVSNIIRLLVK